MPAIWRRGRRFRSVAAVVACLVTTVGLSSPWQVGPPAEAVGVAGTDPSVGAPGSSVGSLLLSQPLAGFTVAPPGPTNGPLTATEFASQSSTPQEAQTQFDALAAQPGFGAAIRLWTETAGRGPGANDLAILLFRIPDHGDAGAFFAGLRTPFEGSGDSTPFVVPSIPGAFGYSVTTTTPAPATEQVVVFRSGGYIAEVQLASSSAPSNEAPLSPFEATTVAYQQYEALPPVAQTGSTQLPNVPTSRTARPTAAESRPGSSLALLLAVLIPIVAVGLALATYRRSRRSQRATARPTGEDDPWGPHGLFALMEAVVPPPAGGSVATDDHGGPAVGQRRPPPRAVPSLPESRPSEPILNR